jgi:dGTPase
MEHHLANPDEIPDTYRQDDAPLVVQAADYVAGMTDRYALSTFARLHGADAAAATGLPGS